MLVCVVLTSTSYIVVIIYDTNGCVGVRLGDDLGGWVGCELFIFVIAACVVCFRVVVVLVVVV